MAWPVKTLVQRIDAIENAYARYIAKDEMPLSEQKARSRILAYEINAMETYIQYMSKQMVPTTAEKNILSIIAPPRAFIANRPLRLTVQLKLPAAPALLSKPARS